MAHMWEAESQPQPEPEPELTSNVAVAPVGGSANMVPKTVVHCHDHSADAGAASDAQVLGAERETRHIHIVTPLPRGNNTMYRFDISGMLYGAGCLPIDLIYTGYTYEGTLPELPADVRAFDAHGTAGKLEQYYHSSKGTLVLKFGPVNRYCNGFSVSYQGHYSNASDGLPEGGRRYSVICSKDDRQL